MIPDCEHFPLPVRQTNRAAGQPLSALVFRNEGTEPVGRSGRNNTFISSLVFFLPSLSLSFSLPFSPCRDLDHGGGPLVPADDVPGVDDAGDPAQDPQADVDEDVGAAPALQEDGHGRDEEGDEVEQDIARRRCGLGHFYYVFFFNWVSFK